ncbi:hypothetical protein UFOVP213_36 [uncultured Caudovirales phage]|uniref:Uncharacterized protein n=1 Tax=uncultured Caudovirales phage TaxID=2100421 RepID=A0A6J7WTL3_9CAUD|nr:hypothetical protein UFOVP213_36 [uncultured Caudovirales phage]
MIQELNEINYSINEGRLLMAALAIITTECRTNKTPNEVINELNQLADEMFQVAELKIETYPEK